MNYLTTRLEDEAEAALKGLKLCNDNYEIAKDLLEKRFGDKQTLTFCHTNKLLSLNNVYDLTDIKSWENYLIYRNSNSQFELLVV